MKNYDLVDNLICTIDRATFGPFVGPFVNGTTGISDRRHGNPNYFRTFLVFSLSFSFSYSVFPFFLRFVSRSYPVAKTVGGRFRFTRASRWCWISIKYDRWQNGMGERKRLSVDLGFPRDAQEEAQYRAIKYFRPLVYAAACIRARRRGFEKSLDLGNIRAKRKRRRRRR